MRTGGVERRGCCTWLSLYVLCYNVIFVMNEMRSYAGSPSFGSLCTFSMTLCNHTLSSAVPAFISFSSGGVRVGVVHPHHWKLLLFFFLSSLLLPIDLNSKLYCCFYCLLLLADFVSHFFFLSCCYKSGHTSSSQLEDCMFSYLLIYKFYIVHMGLFFCVAGLIKDVHTCVLCPHPAPGATVRTSHCSWMSELLFSSSYPG